MRPKAIPPMDYVKREAELSSDGLLRHSLTRIWGPGPRLAVVGHNPSRADHRIDDPTVKRWIYFGREWKFGSLIAFNAVPYRATDPDDCKAWLAGLDLDRRHFILNDNLWRIRRGINECGKVVVCWGDIAGDSPVIDTVVDTLLGMGIDLYCFGKTKSGAPKHVMARGQHRVPDNQKPVVFRIAPLRMTGQ